MGARFLPGLVLLLLALPAWAQTDNNTVTGPVSGKLYVLVDQTAEIYIDGNKVDFPKKEHAAEVTLAPGDRLVAKISSSHYYRHLALLFVSDDGGTEISFRVAHFKLLPDPETTDFTAAAFADFPKKVVPFDEIVNKDQQNIVEKKSSFPVKNVSQFFWGDAKLQTCTVGALITPDMFMPVTP